MLDQKVLDKGFVKLEAVLADDLSVVNAARVSFNNYHDKIEEGDDKLINFLMKNRHGTPFEHNLFRFHIKCPLFVAREWQRHRIGSYNEMSGRYTEMQPDFYMYVHMRSQTGKPGHYQFEPMIGVQAMKAAEVIGSASVKAWDEYQRLLKMGVAKEVARMVLPLNLYTQFYWSVNARSLMNFLSLRSADQAMYEIREYAKAVEVVFNEYMPITAQAFINNNRVAP